MFRIFVTFDVFHEEMSWLNAGADANMPFIFVTFDVFHEEISWLNEDAL